MNANDTAWPESSHFRRRRGLLMWVTISLTPFLLLDLTLPAGWRLTVVGLIWIPALFLLASLQRESRPRLADAAVIASGVVCVAGTVAKMLLSGGTDSPFFGLLLALAPAVALILPEVPSAPIVTGLLSVVAGTAIRAREGRGRGDALYWAAMAAGAMALSVYAAAVWRKHAARELELERTRRQALESLAEVELRRLELERLAEAGRLAAAVAHDVNSPLAAIRSSVFCLLSELDAPREERLEVLRDVAEAVHRIIGTIGKLRQVAQRAQHVGGPEQPTPELLAVTPPPGAPHGARR